MASEVVREIASFRRGIDAELKGSTKTLRTSYNVIIRRTEKRANALAKQIAAMREAGETVGKARLMQLERYNLLLDELMVQVDRFALDVAAPTVENAQLASVWLGQEHADRIERVALGDDGAVFLQTNFVMPNADAIEAISGTMGDGGLVRNYLRETLPQATVNNVADALREGIGAGLNPREVARMAAQSSGLGLTRALTIARTETLRAYREGQRQRWQSTGAAPAYRRTAAQSSRTCLGCIAMDGTIFEMREELEDHPNGRCTAVPVFLINGEVIMPPMQQDAKQWLAAQGEGLQKEVMGPGRWAAWKRGDVEMRDLATYRPNERFGGSWVPRPLYDIEQSSVPPAALRERQAMTVERAVGRIA